MKTAKELILVPIILLSILTGCVMVDSNINGIEDGNNRNTIYGSRHLITFDKDFKDFNSIEINTGFSVELKKSDKYSVTISVDDNLRSYVNTYMTGKKIVIGMNSGNNYKDATLKAIIESPDIETIKASGGTIIDLSGFDFTHGLSVDLSGGSVVKGNINVGSFDLKLSGGGIAELSGAANEMNISGSGGCILNLFELPVTDCSINFSGGSIANINVSGKLDLVLSGGSILKYKGNPTIGNISITGGSIMQKIN